MLKVSKLFISFTFMVSIIVNLALCQDYENIIQKIKKLESAKQRKIDLIDLNLITIKALSQNVKNLDDDVKAYIMDLRRLRQKMHALVDVTDIRSVKEFCWKIWPDDRSNWSFCAGVTHSNYFPIDPDGMEKNLPPIRAHCSLDGRTTLSMDQIIGVVHCSTPLCFTKEISYEAPIQQIQALMASSGNCSQNLTWECLLAPLKTVDGEDLFKWVDFNGTEHTIPGGVCNLPNPSWSSQTITINDKTILPIGKIKYGPIDHVGRGARAIIGPIFCEALPFNERSPFHQCTSLGDRYRYIQEHLGYVINKCYYFEDEEKVFDEAQQNCQGIFGPTNRGKLIEPTYESFHKVQEIAKGSFQGEIKFYDKYVLTGFQKIDDEGNMKHSSTGVPLQRPHFDWLDTSSVSRYGMDVPIMVFNTRTGRWYDRGRSESFFSICELYE